MNLSQLQTFCTVCDCLSFTEAAEKLCISQPAVSRQISALEAEIGTTLFERVHSTIVPTPAGSFLMTRLPQALVSLNNVLLETKRIGNGETGSLSIGLLEDQSLDPIISRALRQFHQEQIYLKIQRLDFRALETALLQGSIDIAVSIQQGSYAFPGCAFCSYSREAMCLAVKEDLIPECTDHITADQLQAIGQRYPILLPSLDSFPASQQQELRSLANCTNPFGQEYDFNSISPMVAAGLVATAVNKTHILSLDHTIRMLPLDEIAPVQKGIFWLQKNNNPVIGKLTELLAEYTPST